MMDAVTFQSEVLKIERLLYHVAYTALGNRQECADAVQMCQVLDRRMKSMSMPDKQKEDELKLFLMELAGRR